MAVLAEAAASLVRGDFDDLPNRLELVLLHEQFVRGLAALREVVRLLAADHDHFLLDGVRARVWL